MKNLIYLLLIVVLASCKGEKGDIGPIGDTGAKGTTGAAGTVGSAGAAGDKGATGVVGATGTTGDKGTTPAVSVIFTDWDNITSWKVTSGSKFNYTTAKSYNLTLLPNSENLLLNFTSLSGAYTVRDTKTKEPVGSFYVYFSITNPAKQEVIFSEDYNYGTFQISDNSSTFFGILNQKTVPTLENELNVNFSPNNYKDSDNFLALLADMKTKIRFIFIPIGMPAKAGRKLTVSPSYQELLEAYNIPKTGTSI